MIGIGIRANPTEINYSIVKDDSDGIEIIQIDKVVIPKSLELPEQLKFIRNTFLDIINENEANVACIRITEAKAKKKNSSRMYIEGVIQELIASSTIEKYYIGQISNISAKLEIERTAFKPFVDGKNIFLEIKNWEKFSKEARESILSAISSLKL